MCQTTTFSLSFDRVEQINPTAADLLRVCAFLAPDTIPESIFTEGARHLGPLLQEVADNELLFDQVRATLLAYSLIHRNRTNQTLNIHRLVQAVMREVQMVDRKENKREWAERTVCAVNAAFFPVNDENWEQCGLLLPHALRCEKMIEKYQQMSPDAARLLQVTGHYLGERMLWAEAGRLSKQALSMWEHLLGNEHLNTAMSLQNLAWFYESQHNYAQAEEVLTRALSIAQKHQENLLMAMSHKSLGWILTSWGKYENKPSKYELAEAHYLRALSILKKQEKQVEQRQVEKLRLEKASGIQGLARLYEYQKNYALAQSQYLQALSIREELLGPQHDKTFQCSLGVITTYLAQGKVREAMTLTLRALQMKETFLEIEDPEALSVLHDVDHRLQNQDISGEICLLLVRALSIYIQHINVESLQQDGTRSIPIMKTTQLLVLLMSSMAALYTDSKQLVQYLQLVLSDLIPPLVSLIEQSFGKEHPFAAYCFQKVEEFHQRLQDLNQGPNESAGPS